MGSGLVESYRNAEKKHKTGGLTLVCLDDSSLDQSKYGSHGQRTIVPRSREEGGIMGLPLGNDCKYGEGVTRRELEDDGNGGFIIVNQTENYRADKAAEDMFSAEALAAAGVELPELDPLVGLKKQAQAAMGSFDPAAPLPTMQTAPPAQSGVQPGMLEMMQMMMQLLQPQQAPAPAVIAPPTPPPAPAKPVGVRVTFQGDFGKATSMFSAVQFEPEFVILVSGENNQTTYEPPTSSQRAITLTALGKECTVVNLGLSFSYKGDILLLMPLAVTKDDEHVEETE